ncbi:uncharacterized protein LOC144942444 [Lampetra fluviatilis]
MEKDRILGSDTSSSSRFSRKFIVISATLLLLIVVVVTAVLLGVFIGGKNATELYQLSMKNDDGKVEQQTVQVNPKENIATFYIQSANLSSTVLLDFNTVSPPRSSSSSIIIISFTSSNQHRNYLEHHLHQHLHQLQHHFHQHPPPTSPPATRLHLLILS